MMLSVLLLVACGQLPPFGPPPPVQNWRLGRVVKPGGGLTPEVFADGHSILAGLNAWEGNRPPYVIQARTGKGTPSDFAIGGSVIADCASRFTT